MVNIQVKNAAFYNDGPLEALMRAYMWTYKNALVEFDEGIPTSQLVVVFTLPSGATSSKLFSFDDFL